MILGREKPHIIDALPAGSIRRRIAFALWRKYGKWVSTEALIAVAWGFDKEPEDPENTLKAHIHWLRGWVALHGYVIDGKQWSGRRLRRNPL